MGLRFRVEGMARKWEGRHGASRVEAIERERMTALAWMIVKQKLTILWGS